MAHSTADVSELSRPTLLDWVGAVALALLLTAAGGLVVASGARAIRHERYEMPWRIGHSISLGPIAGDFKDIEAGEALVLEGPQAVRIGSGLVVLGSMLLIWAALSSHRFIARAWKSKWTSRDVVGQILGWASLACLTFASLCIYPPWQASSPMFYGVALLIGAFFMGLGRNSQERWRGKVLPVFVVMAAIMGLYRVDLFVAMGLGFFAAFGGLVHLAMLIPGVAPALAPKPARKVDRPA